jgi:3-oxoadipate enol-lactonase
VTGSQLSRATASDGDYATPPAMAEALHAGIAGSAYTVIKAGRHLTPLEQPVAIAGEIKQLMEAGR